MTNLTVSQTILSQLGGSRFLAMTGANSLVGGERRLSMKLPRNASKANYLRIDLDANDTYTVSFGAFRGLNIKPVADFANVYADQLREIFERVTGMRCVL